MAIIAMLLYFWACYEEIKEEQELKRKRRNYILNQENQKP
jgi:hypothetical protein